MNNSTPEKNSQTYESLQFLKFFARMYRPKGEMHTFTNEDTENHEQYSTTYC